MYLVTRARTWTLTIAFSWGCGQAPTQPATEIVWDCWHVSTDGDIMRDIGKAAVLTQDLETPGAGSVTAFSETWEARYSVDGIGQRWNYGGGRYAVILNAGGIASYYDFQFGGGMVRHLGLYCERRE